MQDLKHKKVHNGAVLVVDNKTREILAWVNAGKFSSNQIDAVTTPRQPGSTLKPFLYALALKNSWTAASLIDDSPLSQAVGTGLHTIRMRDALGNSLNIPAIRAIKYLGVAKFLQTLHGLGFTSLTAHNDVLANARSSKTRHVFSPEITFWLECFITLTGSNCC